jgi:hypothetical protein
MKVYVVRSCSTDPMDDEVVVGVYGNREAAMFLSTSWEQKSVTQWVSPVVRSSPLTSGWYYVIDVHEVLT